MRPYCLALLSILLFSMCKKEDKTYSGKTQIEFANFKIQKTIPVNQTGNYTIEAKLQIIGKAYSTNKNITISIPEHKNYLVSQSINTTLPANEYTALATITINPNLIKEGTIDTITAIIDKSSDLASADNYSTCYVIIKKQSFIELFTGKYQCEETSTKLVYKTLFTYNTGNTIKNENYWNFSPQNQYVYYTINKDAGQTITIAEQLWTDKLENTYIITGNGIYDLTGKMQIEYTMIDQATNTEYEKGIHIFTPIKE